MDSFSSEHLGLMDEGLMDEGLLDEGLLNEGLLDESAGKEVEVEASLPSVRQT